MSKLEEQLNEQTLQGTVSVNDQNLQQALIETAVLDDLNDVNISNPTDAQILGYQASTNSWQNVNVAIPNGDKGDITTSGGGSTWTINNNAITVNKIANDSVTNAKLANMATATVKGRATTGTGDPEDLAIDNDLSTVSANDDTIPSAKAVKTYVDILDLKTRIRNAGLINGFIRVTVASNNLTVAVSTSPTSQVDPTASNPVYVWIDNTLRTITSALSTTNNAGTNWLNMGGAELATREVDLFVYISWNIVGNNPVIGVARIPFGRRFDSFVASGFDEKGVIRGGNLAGTANSDPYVNIGRFAATLSAGAGHTWSVPAFTNANLIQEPVYETRRLNFLTTFTAAGSGTLVGQYKIINSICHIWFTSASITIASANTNLTASMPISSALFSVGHVTINDINYVTGRVEMQPNAFTLNIQNTSGVATNWTVGSGEVYFQHYYIIQ